MVPFQVRGNQFGRYGSLTAVFATYFPHAFRSTFDIYVPTLLSKLSNNDACSAKLRNEFEGSQYSQFKQLLAKWVSLALIVRGPQPTDWSPC